MTDLNPEELDAVRYAIDDQIAASKVINADHLIDTLTTAKAKLQDGGKPKRASRSKDADS